MSMPPTEANARGLAALEVGDLASAVRYFETAVAVDPHAGSLWRNLAHALRLQHDDAGERQALERALECNQRDISALVRLAQLHERREERRDAMIRWDAVIQLGAGIEEPSPQMAAFLDHALAYCKSEQAIIAEQVQGLLKPRIDRFDECSDRRARAFLDHVLGRRKVYQNNCAGLYYPFLPADEFFDAGHFPWFSSLADLTESIRDELIDLMAATGDVIRPYVRMDKGTSTNKWDSLNDNHNWSACFLWEYGKPNEAVLERCPATAAALAMVPGAQIPGRAPSAFFSMLSPHTRIPPHTGVTNTRAIIHLPLIVPPNCGFRVGGETREWVEGSPFAFDDTIEHEAWNDSDEMRAVLIFDVWNPHLSEEERAVIADYCLAIDNLTAPETADTMA